MYIKRSVCGLLAAPLLKSYLSPWTSQAAHVPNTQFWISVRARTGSSLLQRELLFWICSQMRTKRVQKKGLYRTECYAFSHHKFLLILELTLSSAVVFLPSSFQGINNFVNFIPWQQNIKMNWKRLVHPRFTAPNLNLSQRFQQGSNLQALHVLLWHCKVINQVQHRSSY